MLAKRPPERRQVSSLLLLAAVLLYLIVPSLAGFARADLPSLEDTGNGTRTVSWGMNSSTGLTLQGVELANRNATLPWVPANLTWSTPARFRENATADGNLTYDADGIRLRANGGNRIADGNFTTSSPWTFDQGAGGNVTATWNATTESADFRHNSSSEVQVDSMDSVAAWQGVGGTRWLSKSGQVEGTGMLGLNFSLTPPDTFAGVQHLAPVNWSGFDLAMLWVNATLPLGLNITAFVNSTFRTTSAQPLQAGWQRVAVNLSELGPLRDNLVSLTLRVNGQNVPMTTVYFDDLRLGNRQRFDETARIRQTIVKQNATGTAPGSAILSFNYSLLEASGVRSVVGYVNLSSNASSFTTMFGGPPGPGWNTFLADVSADTPESGSYTLSIGLRVVVENTTASTVAAAVDNVSLWIPERRNGTYISRAIPLPSASAFLDVTWGVEMGGATSALLALRSGNNSSPGSGSWSPWINRTSGGTFAALLPGAAYIQVRVDLQTTNASLSPVLRSLDVGTRHRAAAGTILSWLFNVPSASEVNKTFLRWKTLHVVWQGSGGTSVSFSIGDGTFWQSASDGGDLSSLTLTTIQWKAVLETSDGLVAPTLERVDLVYETRSPAGGSADWASILLVPYSLAAPVAVVLAYGAYQFIGRRLFAVDDVFLISKDGRLMLHNTRRMRADRDEDILSAMLTAILTFVRDFDPEEDGGLRRFDIGGKTAILERGAHAFLAAVYSGRVPRWARKDLKRFMADLEERFGETFAHWNGSPQDLQGLKEFSERFVSRLRYHRPRGNADG